MANNSQRYFKAILNIAIYIVSVVIIAVFLPKLVIFFMPFVIGWIISAIANYPVKFFEEKIKFKRKASSAVFIVLVIGIIIFAGYGIGYFLVTQCIGLITSVPAKWPVWEESFNELGNQIVALTKDLPFDVNASLNKLEDNLESYVGRMVSFVGSPTWNAVASIAKSLPSAIISAFMCVLSAYFFTVDHNSISENMAKKMPKAAYSKVSTVSRGLKRAVGGYFKAQIIIDLWIYVVVVIGLLIMRIDYAFVIALGIAILDFLPFFGTGAVMWPWAVIAVVNKDYFIAAGMMITWIVGQIVRQLIQPKIVGDSVGLKPLPTLFLLYIGYELGGVLGMIIAIPIGIIIVSFYEEGLFDNFILSLKILWRGMNRFREIRPEDLKFKKNPPAEDKGVPAMKETAGESAEGPKEQEDKE